MICPDCGAEYKDHVKLCADCHVLLVGNEEAPRLAAQNIQPDTDDLNLVRVLSVHELGQVNVAKSLLDDAGIPAQARNEGLQDLFGMGRITFNPLAGDVEFWVREDDLDAARAALAGLTEDLPS